MNDEKIPHLKTGYYDNINLIDTAKLTDEDRKRHAVFITKLKRFIAENRSVKYPTAIYHEQCHLHREGDYV